MEVSGQLRALVGLPLGKGRTSWKTNRLLLLSRIEPWFFSR